ncbi:hypothetical protein HZC30_08045 [Candidatus Woesearchaeota archaeon]|nr:hypothetical protein [Candidatus Woesearchaeota archaeon]
MKTIYLKMVAVMMVLALALLVVSCKSASDTDTAKTAASSEEVQVSEGLGEVDDLEQLDKELSEIDDAGIDDLQIE